MSHPLIITLIFFTRLIDVGDQSIGIQTIQFLSDKLEKYREGHIGSSLQQLCCFYTRLGSKISYRLPAIMVQTISGQLY